MELKVTLELSEEQARVVENALEFYSRIGMGQLEEIRYLCMWNIKNWGKLSDEVMAALQKLRAALFPELEPNAYYGIAQAEEPFKKAWDIHQVLRHAVSWHLHPEGGVTVNFNTPMKFGKEKLCKVEVQDDKSKNV